MGRVSVLELVTRSIFGAVILESSVCGGFTATQRVVSILLAGVCFCAVWGLYGALGS